MARIKGESKLIVFRASEVAVLISAIAAFLLVGICAAEKNSSRNALWEIVHYVCVPGESQQHNPKPCLQVDLNEGIEKGFAILKDPRGATQFLLTPTARISGIESADVLGPNATNYFSRAWEARTLIDEAMHRSLPRDDIGLAINSVPGRSQDQLHIHFACVQVNVQQALRKNQGQIGNQWTPFKVSLFGHHYVAMWLSGEHLGPNNPFRFLADRLPDAARNMGDFTLVVIGMTRADGTKGFVLLADQADRTKDDIANGEELLDHDCNIAAIEK